MHATSALQLAHSRLFTGLEKDVEAIMTRLRRKIALAATLGHLDLIYDFSCVPEFFIDSSMRLVDQVSRNMVNDGYYVAALSPTTVFISWDTKVSGPPERALPQG